MRRLFQYSPYSINTFFDSDDDGAAAKKAAEEAAAEAAKKAAEEAAGKRSKDRTYSETEFQQAVEAARIRAEETAKKAISELETHKKNKALTEEEKRALQSKIDELSQQFMTKEELYKQEKTKLVNTYEAEKKTLLEERDTWRNNFIDSTIAREITDAAAREDAHNPSFFLKLLRDNSEVIEDKDESGKTRGFKVQVKLEEVDKDGKPKVLTLDPIQAIKQLKDRPDTHGFLFKGHTATGVGGTGSTSMKTSDLKNLSPEEYRKQRSQILAK